MPWNYGIEATIEQGENIEPEVLLNAFNSLEKPSLLRQNANPPPSYHMISEVLAVVPQSKKAVPRIQQVYLT